MTVSLKHSKTSAKADGADNGLIQPSDWNAEHVLTQATSRLLGRTTAGDGATEEISVGSGLTFGSGSLALGTHSHPISDVTGLQAALDGKQAAGSYAAATHTHPISDITNLQTTLDGKFATTGGTLTGNVSFSGTARRFGGDTSNATVANRLLFQDTTANALTAFGVIPNGTATDTFVQLFNSSNPDNSTILNAFVSATRTGISSSKVGTGSYLPLIVTVGGADRVAVTTDGNVGVGTNSPASKFDVNGGMAQNVVAVAASAIDCSLGNVFTKTASGALTWTFTNVPASRTFTAILELTNGGTGTQTWPASVKWPAGTAPTLTTAGVDVIGFITDDGGTTWRGVQLMKDSK